MSADFLVAFLFALRAIYGRRHIPAKDALDFYNAYCARDL